MRRSGIIALVLLAAQLPLADAAPTLQAYIANFQAKACKLPAKFRDAAQAAGILLTELKPAQLIEWMASGKLQAR
jgi:hypothetical protein